MSGPTGAREGVYGEQVSQGSGATYVGGGVTFTVKVAKAVSQVLSAIQVPGGAAWFNWVPAPGATGFGAGAQGGQSITLKAGVAAVSGAQFIEAASGTSISGVNVEVCYLGG